MEVAVDPIKVTGEELDAESSRAESILLGPPSILVARLGLGGVLGFCTGYAVKQASKAVAVVVGGALVFLQTLQYFGYIEVKWKKIQRDATTALSSEGKETLGVKDVTFWTRRMMKILTHQGPSAGGFAAGIYIGLGM